MREVVDEAIDDRGDCVSMCEGDGGGLAENDDAIFKISSQV